MVPDREGGVTKGVHPVINAQYTEWSVAYRPDFALPFPKRREEQHGQLFPQRGAENQGIATSRGRRERLVYSARYQLQDGTSESLKLLEVVVIGWKVG